MVPPETSAPPRRRILAATDLSPVGDDVCSAAADLAATYGADLHVAHAFGRTSW
jgi:nucleotide-binding universal stress UspA family protein